MLKHDGTDDKEDKMESKKDKVFISHYFIVGEINNFGIFQSVKCFPFSNGVYVTLFYVRIQCLIKRRKGEIKLGRTFLMLSEVCCRSLLYGATLVYFYLGYIFNMNSVLRIFCPTKPHKTK